MIESTQQESLSRSPERSSSGEGSDPAHRLRRLWCQGQQPSVEGFLAGAGPLDACQIASVLRVDQHERGVRGEWVPAETYLDAYPTVAADGEACVDMIYAEYLLREEIGEPPVLEEFQRRFPAYATELSLQVELHRAMDSQDVGADRARSEPATFMTDSRAGDRALSETFPTLAGYEILNVLGRGGMGVVYRAWQKDVNRWVALKMVHAGYFPSADVLERLRVEALAVGRLAHPNIVQIHDVGHSDGAPYLVLELVEGPNLAQRVAGTPQPTHWAAELVETLARAIHSARELGVVHRDLTPSNVLLTALDVPKIPDFGLAKLLTGGGVPHTQTGALLGTPSFMAPEQAAGKHSAIGPATDVYALGAILYDTLTGRAPFVAATPLETARQVQNDEPILPSRLRPKLPADLETICMKCLRKEQRERYSSAGDLALDLRRFLDGRAILARRSSAAERAWRWCRRNRALAAASIAATALMALLSLGAAAAAWIFREQRDQITESLRKAQSSDVEMRRAWTQVRERLFDSLVARARAGRFSRQVGQRFESLDALRQAVQVARELRLPTARLDSLRDEAVACLSLPDLAPEGRVIHRPLSAVRVAFDSTMTRYALRFSDRVQVHKVADDQEVARFKARGSRDIFVFDWSPDGRYLASTHVPGFTLTVWDIERQIVALEEPGPVAGSMSTFSPDGRRISLTHYDGEILVYDLASGRVVRRWQGPTAASNLRYHPDGTRIATLDETNRACKIYESHTGKLVQSIPVPSVASLAWSPDGSALATAGVDNTIQILDVATGIRMASLERSSNGGLRLAFHPSGALLASNGWENRLRLWNPVSGRSVLSLSAIGEPPFFSADGRIFIVREDQLTLYRVDPAIEYRTFSHASKLPHDYIGTSMRHDGRVLAVGTSWGVVLWDLALGAELGFLPIGNAWNLTFEPSGDLLTSGASGVNRWPVRIDSERGRLTVGPPRKLSLPPSSGGIAENRSGAIVALADQANGLVHIVTPERSFVLTPLNDTRGVAVSPDGRWVATGSHERGAQVWLTSDKSLVKDLPIEVGTGVVFGHEGKWLMTHAAPCRLWPVGTWREPRQIGGDGLCFSRDDRLLAVQDASKVIRLVDTETGRTIVRLEDPGLYAVYGATFSPDGSRLVVTTNEGSAAVHVWDLRAIRHSLAGIGLDWDAPAYPQVDAGRATARPLPPLAVDFGYLAEHIELFSETPESMLERFTTRINEHPEDHQAFHLRAHLRRVQQRLPEALDDYHRAIELHPRDAQLLIEQAAVYNELKQFDPAIVCIEAALSVDRKQVHGSPTFAESCNDAAWELAKSSAPSGHLDLALKLAQRALELEPGDFYLLNTLGVVQFRAGRFEESITSLEASMKRGDGQIDAFNLFFLAMAHKRLGRSSQA